MSLVINQNLMSLNAARNLTKSYGALAKSTQRLSSGLRINQGSDDAAGMAISEFMRSDVRALQQGIRNANDAISLIQTADGALGVIDEKLIRMKELAQQAATGTYTSDQRLIIDSEYQAMASEITRIANSTDFNGIFLLNGNLSGTHNGAGLNSTGQLKVHFGTGNDSSEDYYYVQVNGARASDLGLGGGTTTASYAAQNGLTAVSGYQNGSLADLFGSGGYLEDVSQSVKDLFSNSATADRYDDGNRDYIWLAEASNGDIYRMEWLGGSNNTAEVVGSTGSTSSISTQQLAQQALDTVQTAILSKDQIRANLGSTQNRLENTISVLQIQKENLQAAESRISDVDVASEMTNYVRNQILTQAAVSMLAQANSLPRMALSLIG